MKHLFRALAFALAGIAAQPAAAAIVSFDDLSGSGVVADGYSDINWDGNWAYYNASQDPYNPSSGTQRVYGNYGTIGFGYKGISFSFLADSIFDGAYFAGTSTSVYFQMLLDGAVVATSGTLGLSGTATFLSSGYSGLVDTVKVFGSVGYYVMDDVTYTAAPVVPQVPLPAGAVLIVTGLGALGLVRRRKTLA